MKLQHIAYYNDNIDLLFFSEQTADAIVDCAKNNYGGLHSIDSFDATTHTKDEFEEGVLRFTTDGKYAVAMDLPNDLSVLKNPNVCDFFIDIYEVIEEEDFPTEKLCAKKAVSGQIVTMIINNIINDNGNETFEGWCEDGVVFEVAYPNATKEFYEECEKLMKEVAPLVDKLTYNFLAEY